MNDPWNWFGVLVVWTWAGVFIITWRFRRLLAINPVKYFSPGPPILPIFLFGIALSIICSAFWPITLLLIGREIRQEQSAVASKSKPP